MDPNAPRVMVRLDCRILGGGVPLQNAPQENQNLESLLSESDWGEMVVLIFLGKFVISFALFLLFVQRWRTKRKRTEESFLSGFLPQGVFPRWRDQKDAPEQNNQLLIQA